MKPQLTCICQTYGRFQLLRESLACWLAQDCKLGKLQIWNFHEVPIKLAQPYPNVEIINEPHHLDNIDTWLAALDRVKTPFVRIWGDDDLYLPWTVSQGLIYIGNRPAVMPVGRYHFRRDYGGSAHYFVDQQDGGNLTMRTEVAKRPGCIDQNDIITIPDGTFILPDSLGILPYWILVASDYIGGHYNKSHHISCATPAPGRKTRDSIWRSRQNDPGDGVTPLTPASISWHMNIMKEYRPELVHPLSKYSFM